MLIEGIAQYQVYESRQKVSIVDVIPVKVGTPMIKSDFLLTSDGRVAILNGHMLILKNKQIGDSKGRVFSISKTNNEENDLGLEVEYVIDTSKDYPFKYKIEAFDCIYPCTNAKIDNGKLVFEFDRTSKTIEEVIGEIRPLLDSNTSESQSLASYILLCSDGEYQVRFEQLLLDDFESKVNSKGNQSEKNHSGECKDSELIKHVIYEHFNNSGLATLSKAYFSELNFTKYSFYAHTVLKSYETFYFSILKVNNCVTVIISKKLYDFTCVFNLILENNQFIEKLLKITDLGGDSGNAMLKYKGNSNIISKYTIPRCISGEILDFANKGKSLQILESASTLNDAFWLVRAVEEDITPFKFPGLIAIPLLKEMKYLLNGPYPCLFASKEHVDGYISVPLRWIFDRRNECRRDSIWRTYWANLSPESKAVTKESYLELLLKHRKTFKDAFPSSFNSPFLMEKYFLNEAHSHNTLYSYDLENASIGFTKAGTLSLYNALKLWMLIYPGEVDLKRLLSDRNTDLPILCSRACYQKDLQMVKIILKYSQVKFKKLGNFNSISNRRLRWRKGVSSCFKRGRKTHLEVLKSLNLNFNIPKVGLPDVSEVTDIKNNQFSINGKPYKLLHVDDILACIQTGFVPIDVTASITAYLKHYNLPFPTEVFEPNIDAPNTIDVFVQDLNFLKY